MRKEEIRLMVADEKLEVTKNEWEKAFDDLWEKKAKGMATFEDERKEVEAKKEYDKAVREQRKAAAEIDAFSDEEIDAMVDGEPDKDDLTPGENAFLDAIAGLY